MVICPDCKMRMKNGYVYARGPRLAWNPEQRKSGFNVVPGDITIAFASPWKLGDVVTKEAYLCSHCGIVLIKIYENK